MSRKQFAYISALDNDLISDTFGVSQNPLTFVCLRGACCVSALLWKAKTVVWLLTCPVLAAFRPAFPLPARPRGRQSICGLLRLPVSALTNAIFSATFRRAGLGVCSAWQRCMWHATTALSDRVQLRKWPGISQMWAWATSKWFHIEWLRGRRRRR